MYIDESQDILQYTQETDYRYFSINRRISNNSRPPTLEKVSKYLKHHNFVTTYDRGIIQRPLERSFKDLSNDTKYMWV